VVKGSGPAPTGFSGAPEAGGLSGGDGLAGGLLERVRRRLVADYPDLLARARADEDGRESVRRAIRQVLVAEGGGGGRARRDRLVAVLFEEIAGYGPLESLLADPGVSEVMVNGARRVYVEREGRLEPTGVTFRDEGHVLEVVARMLGPTGRRVDKSQPYVDARLPDGSRVNVIIPPLAVDGPAVTIRRFGAGRSGPPDLVGLGTVDPARMRALARAVRGRLNIVISGGAASGKTTFLNGLAGCISLEEERIVTIEDAAELRLGEGNLVRLECRPPNIEGRGEVDARQLVRNALRMRPDRIIVGECRGAEATGHPGSMTTVHANGPADALRRLELMVLMAGEGLPYEAVREHIGTAVDLVVHLVRRRDGSRVVSDIRVVRSYRRSLGSYDLAPAGLAGPDGSGMPLTAEQAERLALYSGASHATLRRGEENG